MGEVAFEQKHSIDLLELAKEFLARSPYWKRVMNTV